MKLAHNSPKTWRIIVDYVSVTRFASFYCGYYDMEKYTTSNKLPKSICRFKKIKCHTQTPEPIDENQISFIKYEPETH